jgi:hypothetical protein
MTEAQWRSGGDPAPMLEFLRGRASERKLRLFACAVKRVVFGPSGDDYFQRIENGDGREGLDELSNNAAEFARQWAVYDFTKISVGKPITSRFKADLIREFFGNPFRPSTLDRSRLMPLVVSLAEAAYEERHLPSGQLDAARLAVLSDALEESGCADIDLLAHLRSPGPHVRGCWAVDLVLGKG